MKKWMFASSVLAAAALTAFLSCNTSETKNEANVSISKDSLVSRGKYIVNAAGCDDCHTPKKMGPNGPEPDMEYRFSGQLANRMPPPADTSAVSKGWLSFSMDLTAIVGPWGTSYAANISSDETGIGGWTEDQFINCIRNGKSKGINEGRPLLPPMPWPSYRNFSDTDLKAIFAYLKSSKPISNRVPGPKPPGQP